MKSFLSFAVVILAGSIAFAAPRDCGKWKLHDVKDEFSFCLPKNTVQVPVQGIDSFVEQFTVDGIELSFDYGRYSDPLNYATKPEYMGNVITIDGLGAKHVFFNNSADNQKFPYVSAVHFHTFKKEGVKLTMWANCKGPKELIVVRKIFDSIQRHL